jgi:hypothetical protein
LSAGVKYFGFVKRGSKRKDNPFPKKFVKVYRPIVFRAE